MCRFINLVFSQSIGFDNIEAALLGNDFGCHRFENGVVANQLEYGSQLVNTTSQQCDCDSVVGIESMGMNISVTPKDIQKLKHKGWSAAKIDKWITNKARSPSAMACEAERLRWMKLLRVLLEENNVKKVGLYIHWYVKGLSAEEIIFKHQERISIATMNPLMLDQLAYDVIYEFVP